MGRPKTGVLSLSLCCCITWWATASIAATDAPTVQALLAEEDAELVKRTVAWSKSEFELPEGMKLDAALRASVESLVQDHLARVRTLTPTWIAEERAAAKNPGLRAASLSQAVYRRWINEIAITSVESAGTAHDAASLKAALAPNACRYLYAEHFAQRIAMIQEAPADDRQALLAAEKELLSRWGSKRADLPPRPPAADLMAADQAITRLRAGLPVTAAPMTPYLAQRTFARDRKPGRLDRWEQCARSQWWLQSQLAAGNVDRAQALAIYRYSRMTDASDFVPSSYEQKPMRRAEGKPDYPRSANYFQIEGSTTLKVSTDEQGKAFKAEIVARQIVAPGVRNNRAVAFETLFDEAALEFARQRSYPAGKAGDGQFVMVWKLEDNDEAK